MTPDLLGSMKRTDYSGKLRLSDVGKEVAVTGWVQRQRDLGSLIFIDLRDRTGICQIVFDGDTDPELFDKAFAVRAEFVLGVRGMVRERSSKNPDIPTGDIEVFARELVIINPAATPPFLVEDWENVNDTLALRYRYLSLRSQKLQKNLALRHKIAKIARDYFDENGFLEIETPVLTKSTPEGARDYLVPSRVHPGKFYALPQSPQIYKQLLMLSGFDRYFQIARCFRDEDLRADRQPEFTQIDLEMSFVDEEDVIAVNEGFLKRVFSDVMGTQLHTPFLRIPYREAMEKYGSDKPDIRFGFTLCDLTEVVRGCSFSVFDDAAAKSGYSVRGININGGAGSFSRKEIDSLAEFAKGYGAKGLVWIKVGDGELVSPVAKFLSEEKKAGILSATDAKPGDLLLLVADRDKTVFQTLGALRCEVARRLGVLKPGEYRFCWVTEFPLFEYDEEEGRYFAMHHPFTSPRDEDLDRLESDPGSVRAKAYDIVLNGVELGGGSIRIHKADVQERMFSALGFTKEQASKQFGFLMDAFSYGAPPHGGLAYGLDRLVMLLSGADSIRDVIAFPKVQNAGEVMMNSPDFVDEKQLLELHIALCKEEDKK